MVAFAQQGSKLGFSDNLSFRKLGHLTLDKNEKSNYTSRELKSVYIDASLDFLKLVFHAPYPNDHNTFSQVGIINIKCFGTVIGESGEILPPQTSLDVSPNIFQSLKTYMGTDDEPKLPQTALPPPEPLPEYFERDYPQVVDSLTLPIASHISSRDWRLREKGITLLMERLKASSNPADIVPAFVWTIKRLITDKIVNVYIRITELIQLIVMRYPKPQSPELNDVLDLAILHMIDNRLCDFNKRISDATIVTLVSIAKDMDKRVYPVASLVIQYSMKPFDGASRIVAGRCALMSALLNTVGVKTKRNDLGVPMEPLLPLIATWLNKGGDVRVSALHVLNSILACLDFPKLEALLLTSNLPDSLRQVVLFEASRIGPGNMRPIDRISECEFCGKSDPAFADQANMDLHYWDECPLLIECRFCEQIVEITCLTEHRLKECENETECGL